MSELDEILSRRISSLKIKKEIRQEIKFTRRQIKSIHISVVNRLSKIMTRRIKRIYRKTELQFHLLSKKFIKQISE